MKLGEVSNSEAAEFGRPLEGVKILALEQMQSLPWATQMLARLGADVVKVEHPQYGESGRASQPAISDPNGRSMGATFLRTNLNKRSIGIDIKSAEGQELIRKLATQFDVVCENFKPGTLEKMGLDYRSLAKISSKMIYLSVSGFGNTRESPYKSWPAFASVAEAMSGLYESQSPPLMNPVPGLGDTGTGLFSVIGVLAALRHRELTGLGQYVDISMFDSMLSVGDYPLNVWSMGIQPKPNEKANQPGLAARFQACDGAFIVQTYRENQFERFARAVGREEWLRDFRLATRTDWSRNADTVLKPAVDNWAKDKTMVEACEILASAGVACAPCMRPSDLFEDPHVAAHDMLVEIPQPSGKGDPVVVAGNPLKFSRVVDGGDKRMPWVGEHTEAVLKEDLGLSNEEIAQLEERGVISKLVPVNFPGE